MVKKIKTLKTIQKKWGKNTEVTASKLKTLDHGTSHQKLFWL